MKNGVNLGVTSPPQIFFIFFGSSHMIRTEVITGFGLSLKSKTTEELSQKISY